MDMEANVLDWEPELALFVPDSDPLRFYRRIAWKGLDWLSEGGALYFEINRAYGAETVWMLEELGYCQIEFRIDGQHFNPNLIFDMKGRTLRKTEIVCAKTGNRVIVKQNLTPKK